MHTQLTAALNAHLARVRPGMRRRSTLRQIPMSEWQGVGQAAKRKVDAIFAPWTDGAALTPALSSARASQVFNSDGTAGPQTLFNAWDRGDRARAGAGIDAPDLTSWMLDTNRSAQSAMQAHHFDRYRDRTADPAQEEQAFLDRFIATYATAHRADLELYDQFDFAITDSETGRIAMFPGVQEGISDAATSGGILPAERHARWGGFKTLTHEYIHTLEHPTFNHASRGRRIMIEGFCELFTKDVLSPDIAGAVGDAALRRDVEGGTYPVDAAAIGSYSPGSYAEYLGHAEAIRDAAPGRDNAARAAFFQGHLEMIGLAPDGTMVTAATIAERDTIAVPAGISTVAALASAAGLSEAEVRAANPAITTPLPSRVALPGCREHHVVDVSPTGGGHVVEGRREIAAQNGVSEAELIRANPGITNWAGLTAGQRLLIPRH